MSETRYELLTWLAWHLHPCGFTVWVVLHGVGEPFLYILRGDGRRRTAVMAIEKAGDWSFVWGTDEQIRASRTRDVVQTIARAVRS